jgi:hypothetical protein
MQVSENIREIVSYDAGTGVFRLSLRGQLATPCSLPNVAPDWV